jgi:CBS domain-containing protein
MAKTTELLVDKFMETLQPVKEDTEVAEIIETMKNEKTTFLPVVNKDEKLIGCVFDYNLLKLVRFESAPLAGTVWKDSIDKADGKKKAKEIMDTKIVTVSSNDTIDSALRVMDNNDARVLTVTDKDGKFIGVLRLRTIFGRLLKESE